MAVNNLKGIYDPLISNRPPVAGDIQRQYDIVTDSHRTAIFDGHRWNELKAPPTITSHNQLYDVAPITGNGSFAAVSNAAGQIKNDVVTMLEHNLRVAEVYDTTTLKLKRAELQYRDGPGSEWTPIQRTKLYE